MSPNHILVIHDMTPQHYIWLIFYDLSLMIIGWKPSLLTFNDCLFFATHPLELKAFSHIMSSMTTKSFIYGLIDLRFFSSVILC
jgi:hypothetical protein